MSAMERITGYDFWSWVLHLWAQTIRAAHTAMKASGIASFGQAAGADKWQPSTYATEAVIYTFLIGLAWGFLEALAENPHPTGKEVAEG